MSGFLRHLIARHQAAAAGPEPGRVVQPRPRSRFEGESAGHPGEEPRTPDAVFEAMPAATTGPAAVPAPGRPIRRPDHVPTERVPDDAAGRITEPRSPLARREAAVREPADRASAQPDRPPGPAAARLSDELPRSRPARADARAPAVPDQPGRTVGDMPGPALRRSGPRSRDRSIDDRPDAVVSRRSDGEAPGMDRRRAQEAPAEPANPARAVAPDLETGPRSADSDRRGALQAPDWAAEVQAALRGQPGPTGPQREAEPTVNVTIGRIEIRAVTQPQRKGRDARPAPGPIMTLDDYLKQRNGRRP